MTNFEKKLEEIMAKSLEYKKNKSITLAVEVTNELAELAERLIKLAELTEDF